MKNEKSDVTDELDEEDFDNQETGKALNDCKDKLRDRHDDVHKTLNNELNYNIVSGNNSENVISSIFKKEMTNYLLKLIDKDKYIFSGNNNIKIKESKRESIIKILQEIGDIVLTEDNIIIVKNKEGFIIVSIAYDYEVSSTTIDVNYRSTTLDKLEILINNFKKNILSLTVTEERYIFLSWYYSTENGYRSVGINDHLYDTFCQEAYPYLNMEKLAKQYIEGDEPILVLLGPPGTGKTRLIRFILNCLCERDKKNISVMVTSDQKIIEAGNLFVSFIGDDKFRALVIEDIDYHLTSRREGNTAMYNFLSISNGLAIGHQKDKKIILSTNLPNITNIDPALLRPGRCFASITTRKLSYDESKILLKKLNISPTNISPKSTYSLGELYSFGKDKTTKSFQQNVGFANN